MPDQMIGNAANGEDLSVDWAEKLPVTGSKFMALSTIRDAIVSYLLSYTGTVTNKRIQKRAVTVTQSATPTINTDNGDIFNITALAQAITSLTTNLSGTPVVDEMIMINITDDGTARAITRGAKFVNTSGATMATTTVLGKKLCEIFKWNATLAAWQCVGSTSDL